MLYNWKPKFLGKPGANSQTATNGIIPANVQQIAEGTLTSAQILALNTTPVQLIPAPGAGKYISVDEIVLTLNFGTTQYTGTNAMNFTYTNGSGNALTGTAANSWINSAATAALKVIGVAVTPTANAALVASVGTANPAAGDSTISYSIIYRVVTLPSTMVA